MLGRFHLGEDGGDFSRGIDDEGGPFRPHVFFAVHRFLNPDPVGLHDFFFRIGEKREGEVELPDEFLVGFHRVDADPEEMRARGLDFPPGIADAAGLRGASRRVVLRIKVEDDGGSLQIREFQGATRSVGSADGGGGEGGGLVSSLKNIHGL